MRTAHMHVRSRLTQTANILLLGYTRLHYDLNTEAIFAQGMGYFVPDRAEDVLSFFELDGSTTTMSVGPTSTTAAPTSTVGTTATPVLTPGTAPFWSQCGSVGSTVCPWFGSISGWLCAEHSSC